MAGKYVKYLQYFKPFNAITHPDYKGEDPAWVAGFWPGTRFAIHVFDRNDDNKLKILAKGNAIFKHFYNFRQVHGINPTGKGDAPDFIITVKIPLGDDGKPNKINTEYTVTPSLDLKSLTEEEVATYKEKKVDLKEKYRSLPLEKIKEMWEALTDAQRTPPKRKDNKGSGSTSAPPKTEEPKVEAPAEDIKDDMPDAPAEENDPFSEESTPETSKETEVVEEDSSDLF